MLLNWSVKCIGRDVEEFGSFDRGKIESNIRFHDRRDQCSYLKLMAMSAFSF